MSEVVEGKAKILVEPKKIVDKKMPVFYNPVMIVNRDFSLLVLEALNKKDMKIGDVLAGSGIRSLRLLKELDKNKIKEITINDIKEGFLETFEKNIKLNNLEKDKNKIIITNKDANKILSQNHFDYIEIDPFGTPNPFLDSAIRSIRRDGILSVTATDTSALCGSYPKACRRKYWAKPLRNELMHEFGVRILIRKIQLLGAHHEKALIPIISYATDHYVKVFLQSANSKTKIDEIITQHQYYDDKGPIWMGPLQDAEFIKKIEKTKLNLSKKTNKLIELLKEEAKIKKPFFYDLHEISSCEKAKRIPKKEKVITELKKENFDATSTHFNDNAIKTNANKEEFMKIYKKLI